MQEAERALAAIQMISNGTIKDRALSMTGASEAIMSYLTKLGVTSAEELTFAQRLNLTVVALKEQAAAFLKSPLGKAVIIAAAIFAVVKLAQHLANAAERAAEKLSEIGDELSGLLAEIDSVNSALESTKQRIAELQAKGPLTFTEEAELTRLQKENAELERKLELLEANRAAGNSKFENTFIDAFNSQYGDERSFTASGKKDWTDWLYNALSEDNIETYTGAEYIELQFSQYAKAMRGGKAYARYLDEYKSNLGEVFNDYQEYLKQLETAMYKYGDNAQIDSYIDQINEFNDRYLIAFGDAQNLFMQIISRDKFTEAYDAIKQLGNITGESLLALYNSNSNVKELVDYLMGLGQIDWKTILGDDEFARLDTNSDDALTRIELFDQETGECKISSEQWAKAMGGIVNQMQSLASDTKVATKEIKYFKAVLSGINKLSAGLDQLDSIYADIYDKEDFDWSSILGNEDFTNAFGGLGDAYDDFIKTVANAPDDISACQSAFDNLATAYIVNSGALKDVTDDTRDATVAMLEQMGVANAAALVDEQLALNKETLRLQSELQADATHQEVLALFDEETATRITAQAIFELAIAKIQTNENSIVTSSDIDQLEALAKSAGASTESLLNLAKAKALMAEAEGYKAASDAAQKAGDGHGFQLNLVKAQATLKKAEEYYNKPITYDVDFSKYKAVIYAGGREASNAINGAKNDIESLYDAAKNGLEELIDYRKSMIEQDAKNQKDALEEQIDALRDFYDEQREMLEDQYNEEEYLAEQHEKQKSVTDLKGELAMLANDDSAWAQRRRLEIQEELLDAEDDLSDFEKNHALDLTLDMLDDQQESQEKQIQAQIDALDARLNDPHALYNQALSDIKNNTLDLYLEMVEFNRRYGSGNDNDIADMWNDAYASNESYRDETGSTYEGINLGDYAGTAFGNNYNSPPSKGDSVVVKSSATHFGSKSGGVRMAALVPGGKYIVYQNYGSGNDAQVLIGRNGAHVGWVKLSDIVGYKSGTAYSTGGLAQFDEEGRGSEYIFESSDGNRYRMFAEGSKVLNAGATDFLYNFATTGGNFLTKMIADMFRVEGFKNIVKPAQAVALSTGDIHIHGNADNKTVSEIRRAQRENLDFFLKSLNKLNK